MECVAFLESRLLVCRPQLMDGRRGKPRKEAPAKSSALLQGARLWSDALVDQSCEVAWIDNEIAPLSVKCGGRFRRDGFVSRPSLLFERRHVFPDGCEHVAEFLELGSVAGRLTVAWNDNCVLCRRREIDVGCGDHPVDATAR
jgi:hypothetical protein